MHHGRRPRAGDEITRPVSVPDGPRQRVWHVVSRSPRGLAVLHNRSRWLPCDRRDSGHPIRRRRLLWVSAAKGHLVRHGYIEPCRRSVCLGAVLQVASHVGVVRLRDDTLGRACLRSGTRVAITEQSPGFRQNRDRANFDRRQLRHQHLDEAERERSARRSRGRSAQCRSPLIPNCPLACMVRGCVVDIRSLHAGVELGTACARLSTAIAPVRETKFDSPPRNC